MMIFADTETTGLLEAEEADVSRQPYIIEVCFIRLTEDYKFVDSVETLIKPPVPISEEITRITGITNEMVADKPEFPEVYASIVELFLGARTFVAHNARFDTGMLWCELVRMGKEFHFPWPPEWFCTVERSFHIEQRRLKLKYLHKLATGEEHEGQHRARSDVEALVRCYKWLKEQA